MAKTISWAYLIHLHFVLECCFHLFPGSFPVKILCACSKSFKTIRRLLHSIFRVFVDQSVNYNPDRVYPCPLSNIRLKPLLYNLDGVPRMHPVKKSVTSEQDSIGKRKPVHPTLPHPPLLITSSPRLLQIWGLRITTTSSWLPYTEACPPHKSIPHEATQYR